jgi:hypothetical protein
LFQSTFFIIDGIACSFFEAGTCRRAALELLFGIGVIEDDWFGCFGLFGI